MQCDLTLGSTLHEGSRADRRQRDPKKRSLAPTVDPIRRFEPRRKGRNKRLHVAAA